MNPTLKKILIYAAIAIALLATGIGIGRFTTPAKVVVDERKVEQLATQLAQTKVEQIITQRIEEYKSTHKEEFTVVKWKKVRIEVPCPSVPAPEGGCKPPCATDCNKCPKQIISIDSGSTTDGTNTTNTTGGATTNTNTNTNTQTNATSNSTTTTDTHTETTYYKPQWILSLKGGLNLSNPSQLSSVPVTNLFVYGGEVDKRLAGPLWIGAWGYSDLKFGLSLSWEL